MAKVQIEFVGDGQQAIQETSKVGGALSGLGSKAASIASGGLALVATGLAAVTSAAAATAVAAFNLIGDIDQATNKLATDLGISKEAAGQFEGVMKGVFANNFGENFADIGASVAEVSRQLGSLPDMELQRVTEQAFALRDAWGTEITESVGAADALMENFGLTSQEAMDFLTAGIQRGLNSSGDFLDSITEYSTQFSAGGASADQFFSLMETGLQQGMLGTDKAADMFKEFRLRITEGGPAVSSALEAIGLDADEMAAGIANGTITAADAFGLVNEALAGVDDQSAQFTAGIALMGSQFEDMGTEAALAVDLTTTKLGDLAGATDTLNQQYDNWPSMWEGFKRNAMLALEPLGETLMGLASDIMPQLQDVFENQVVPAAQTFLDVFNSFIGNLEEGMTPLDAFIESIWDIAPEGLLDALTTFRDRVSDLKDGFGLLAEAASAIFGGDAADIDYWWEIAEAFGLTSEQAEALNEPLWELGLAAQDAIQYAEGLLEAVGGFADTLEPAAVSLGTFAQSVVDAFSENGAAGALTRFSELWPGVAANIDETTAQLANVVQEAIGVELVGTFETAQTATSEAFGVIQAVIIAFIDAVSPAFDGFSEDMTTAFASFNELIPVFGELWEAVKPLVIGAVNAIGAVVLGLVGVVAGVVRGVVEALDNIVLAFKNLLSGVTQILTGLINFVTGLFNASASALQGDMDGIVAAFGQMWEGVQQIVSGLFEGVVGTLTQLGVAVFDIVAGLVMGVIDFFKSLYDELVGHSIIPDMAKAIIEVFTSLKTAVVERVSALVGSITGKFNEARQKVQPLIDALKGFWDWISNKVFEFKIKLPELPDWATPGSPIPLHTRWKEFGDYLNQNTFTFKADFSDFTAPGGGSGGGDFLGQARDIFEQISQLADFFKDEVIKKTQLFAEASKSIADMVGPILEAIEILRQATDVTIDYHKVFAWGYSVEVIFNRVAEVAYRFAALGGNGQLIEQVKSFTDAAIKLTDLISSSLEAIDQLAQSDETLDIGAKVNALGNQIEHVVMALGRVAFMFSYDLLQHMQVFAKSAGEMFGLAKAAAEGIKALDEFAGEPVPAEKIQTFGAQIAIVVWELSRIAVLFDTELLDILKGFAERTKSVLGIVKPGIDALADIANFVGLPNAQRQVTLFVNQLYLLASELARAFGEISWGAALDAAILLPEKIKQLFAVIKPGLDALRAINESTQIENLQEKVNLFRSQLLAVARALAYSFSMAGFFNDFDAALDAAAYLPEKINKLLVVVGPGLKALQDIDQITHIDFLLEKVNTFRSQLLALARALAFSFSQAGFFNDFDAALDAAGYLPEKINKLLTAVKPGLDALAAIGEFVGISELTTRLNLFTAQLVEVVLALNSALNDGLAGLEEALASSGNLSGLAKEVLETVKRGVDSLTALAEFTGVEGLDGRLTTFTEQLIATVIALKDALNDGLGGMEEALASAGKLSGLAKEVLDAVKRGVESVMALAEFEPLDNARKTAVAFADDLVAIVQEMVAKLSQAAANLAQEDIDAAAGLAERSAELVKHISDVQKDLGDIVSGDMVEIGQLKNALDNVGAAVDVAIARTNDLVTGDDVNGLTAVMQQMLDRILSFATPMYDAGRVLGNSLIDGMRAALQERMGEIQAALTVGGSGGGTGSAGLMAAAGGGGGAGAPVLVFNTTINSAVDQQQFENRVSDVVRRWLAQ